MTTTYTITGNVPFKQLDHKASTFYEHHESTKPTKQPKREETTPHPITVTTQSEKIAEYMKNVFDNLFEDAMVEAKE